MTTTPGIADGTNFTLRLLLDEMPQVLAVCARRHRLRKPQHVGGGDVAEPERDLLQTRDHEPLPVFDSLDVIGSLHERFVRAGIEPRDAPAEALHRQLAALEIV